MLERKTGTISKCFNVYVIMYYKAHPVSDWNKLGNYFYINFLLPPIERDLIGRMVPVVDLCCKWLTRLMWVRAQIPPPPSVKGWLFFFFRKLLNVGFSPVSLFSCPGFPPQISMVVTI